MKAWNFIKLWCTRLGKAAAKWWHHKHADEAAALAFYSLISLVPILLVGITIASVFVDQETATRILVAEADRVAGATVGGYFAQILKTEIHWVGSGISPLIGGLLLFFGSGYSGFIGYVWLGGHCYLEQFYLYTAHYHYGHHYSFNC